MTGEEWKASIERTMERLDRWKDNADARLRTLETNDAESKVLQKTTQQDVADIKDTLKWLVRLIIGALLLALITFVLDGGLNLVPQ